jgi:hypothetical protein
MADEDKKDEDKKSDKEMAADQLEGAFLKSEYAWAYRLIMSNDQLKDLWKTAIKERWEPSKFILEFRDSDYYQDHTEQWLKVEALKKTKPEAYREEKRSAAARLRDDAVAAGAKISEKQALKMADDYLRLGFSDPKNAAAYQDWLGKRVRPGSTADGVDLGFSGAAGQAEQALTAALTANGFDPNNDKWKQWAANQVRKATVGDVNVEDSVDYIRRQAASRYRAFGDEMVATGRDLNYYATPYIEALQSTLELSDAEANMQNSLVKKALEGYQDEKGQWKQQSLWEFEKDLRKDSRWRTTQNANDEGNKMLNDILRRFGVGV